MSHRRLAEKAAAKYNPQMEAEAREWIEAVLGEPLASGSFQEALKSGIALCKLVRTIQPDIIGPPSTMSAPFKQMENIGNYLSACTKLGLQAHDSFQTVDLYEGKDVRAVVRNLHSLGRVSQNIATFDGPYLGARLSTPNERHFSEAQLAEARAMPARWTNVGKSLKKLGAAGALAAGAGAPA